MQDGERSQWGSSFGFLMAAAGSAIGLGNLWKFPYMAGKNGGGAFLLIYLFFVAIAGIPLILGELTIGRHTRQNPIGAFNILDKRFKFVGVLGVLSAVLIPFYYSVVGGWVLAFIFRFVIYITEGIPADIPSLFGRFSSNAWEPLVWSTLFVFFTAAIIYNGVDKGIERFSKTMMPMLFLLLLVTIVRSVTLPGAWEGVVFLFKPKWADVTLSGVMDAMGQMFWSMSLGMGIMITYGSYMRKSSNLAFSATSIPIIDTLAAVMGGLCILPAVFAFGIAPDKGPSLTFITLPMIFAKMPAGVFFGIVFFILLFLAAITSNVSLMEVGVGFLIDRFRISRPKATVIIGALTAVFAIPCSLAMGELSGFKIFGMDLFTLVDYVSQNIFMIVAGLFTCIFIGYVWGVDRALEEISNQGELKTPFAGAWRFLIRYVSPVVILVVLLRAIEVI